MITDDIKKTETGDFYLLNRNDWDGHMEEADTLRKIVSRLQSAVSRRLREDVVDVEKLFNSYNIIAETDDKRDFFDVIYDKDKGVCYLKSLYTYQKYEFNIKLPDMKKLYKLTEYKLDNENEVHGVFTSEKDLLKKIANIISERIAYKEVESYFKACKLLKIETSEGYNDVYIETENENSDDLFPILYLKDKETYDTICELYMKDIIGKHINLTGIKAKVTDIYDERYGNEFIVYPVDFERWVLMSSNYWYKDTDGNVYSESELDLDDWELDRY